MKANFVTFHKVNDVWVTFFSIHRKINLKRYHFSEEGILFHLRSCTLEKIKEHAIIKTKWRVHAKGNRDMEFDNILFHNVEELEKTEKGYLPRRIRKDIREQISTGVQENIYATGVELRFTMPKGSVDIVLRADMVPESATLHIFFGSFQGGWDQSSKNIYETETRIHIEYPEERKMETLRRITAEQKLPFQPEVVRIVLPYVPCYYVCTEGVTEVPKPEQLPRETYLAYGSSITHGSLGLIQPDSYVFRISQLLGTDYINLGFAGRALMEEEMAKYIISRKDWNFASVEMGVNALEIKKGIPTLEAFEERIDKFTAVLAEDPRPIFATSIFGFNDDPEQERAEKMRRIVKKYAASRLIYTDGLQLLDNSCFISADLVHPSVQGQQQIAERWSRVMEEYKEYRSHASCAL